MKTKLTLTPTLTKRLLAYTAAGAGHVHLSSPIYTPAHNNVNEDFYIDLNHDSIVDFHIHSHYIFGEGR